MILQDVQRLRGLRKLVLPVLHGPSRGGKIVLQLLLDDFRAPKIVRPVLPHEISGGKKVLHVLQRVLPEPKVTLQVLPNDFLVLENALQDVRRGIFLSWMIEKGVRS